MHSHRSSVFARAFFLGCALLSLTPFVSAGAALVGGMALTLVFGNPFLEKCHGLSPHLLALSIVGLGGGMDLRNVWRYGAGSAGYTGVEIALALSIGICLGLWLRTQRNTSYLISSGVSVCGASAIAVIALSIRARPHEISLSLAVIFILNAIGILCLPWLGHLAGLDQVQFGLWSALSITDTSSVVGATMSYGSTAIEVAMNAKLARALWIVPLAFLVRRATHTDTQSLVDSKRSFPWFILGFIAIAALVTWIPELRPTGQVLASLAKRLLVLTLFVMGTTLTRALVGQIGIRPLVQGFLLWAMVTAATFGAITRGWIH